MSQTFHFPCHAHCNNTWLRAEIMNLLITKPSPIPGTLPPCSQTPFI